MPQDDPDRTIAAEIALLDRRIITIPAEDWAHLTAFLAHPPRDIPALRKLLSSKPVWEK
jgi:uncharacterized protein (DUF1778 family)